MIQHIQKKLQHLYRLHDMPCVEDYFIQRETILSFGLLDRPQVVVFFEKEGANVGVYLGQDEFEHASTWSRFAVYTEEISHFLFLMWRLQHDQELSLLDLEVQGEIDKFLLTADMWGVDHTTMEQTFGRYDLHDELSQAEKKRYHHAHFLGKGFAKNIITKKWRYGTMMRFLREFYRKSSIYRISTLRKLRVQWLNGKKLVSFSQGW